MKLTFLPGNLHLREEGDNYVVAIAEEEVLRTTVQKAALKKFNEIRAKMEKEYPTRELSPEEKAAMLRRAIGDSLVGHNSLGGRKKKSTAGGTRTFGG